MKNKYFKKFWNETTGDEVTDSWGNSTYYFETDENLNVLKQVQIFENKKTTKIVVFSLYYIISNSLI